MKPKVKVQQYPSASSFLRNSLGFLSQNESLNNIFWEVSKSWHAGKRVRWAGNIFRNGKVELSALYLPTNYILLSVGGALGVERLTRYGKAKKWNVSGVTGPRKVVAQFASLWDGDLIKSKIAKRFIVFESGECNFHRFSNQGLDLVKATEFEWPRIRLWAEEFANESNPSLDPQFTILMAKSMLKKNNLYVLKKGQQSMGMAGFGRETDKKIVINMVFVPRDLRRRKIASILVSSLFEVAYKRGFSNSLMFSDHLQNANLYEALGCIKIGEFDEIKFEN